MKNYNIQNYIRYKKDLEQAYKRIPHNGDYENYSRDQLVVLFMPLVENIARKFATSQQASGVMSINDIIQEGNLNLVKAIDRINWDTIADSEDPEKNPLAKKYSSISFDEALKQKLSVMDLTAFTLCQENNLPIKVFNMNILDMYKD